MLFNTGNDQGIHNPYANRQNLFDTDYKSVLYVFSPRPFGAQLRRSLIYNFNDNFINRAHDTFYGKNDSPVSMNHNVDKLLRDNSALGTILPVSNSGLVTNLQELNQWWTFLLVVDGERSHHQRESAAGFNQQSSTFSQNQQKRLNNNRAIYYGYCMDEPINPTTRTPNPNARLMITHKTLLSQMTGIGPMGNVPRFDVLADRDFVDPSVLNLISNQKLTKMTPDTLIENTEVVDDGTGSTGYWSSFGESTEILDNQPAMSINARYSEPNENLRTLMGSIASATDAVTSLSHMGQLSQPQLQINDEMGFGNHDTFTHVLIDNLRSADISDSIGLRENETVTMAYLESRYDPEIQPFIIERHTQWETANQFEQSLSNIWSSLVMQSSPIIMTNAGISEISLEYDSYRDEHRIFTISYMAGVADQIKGAIHRSFMYTMKERIFKLMVSQAGHFRIHLSLQSSGVSSCILNFHDSEYKTTAPFEVPSIAGGLNSNMLGDVNMAAHNGSEFSQFVDIVSGKSSDHALNTSPQVAQDYARNVNAIQNPYGHANHGQMLQSPGQSSVPDPYGSPQPTRSSTNPYE